MKITVPDSPDVTLASVDSALLPPLSSLQYKLMNQSQNLSIIFKKVKHGENLGHGQHDTADQKWQEDAEFF